MPMKYVAAFAVLLALALAWRVPNSNTTAYGIQLIRGTDTGERPEGGGQNVGPELAAAFQSVFRWKDYWQVASFRAVVPSGKIARLRLNNERGVEIDLTCPGKRNVAALW